MSVTITATEITKANNPQPLNQLESGIVRANVYNDVVTDLNSLATAVNTLEENKVALITNGDDPTATDSGTVIILSNGETISLTDAKEAGVHLKFIITADDGYTIYGTAELAGGVTMVSDDGTASAFAPVAPNDTIIMNGSTTGGLSGSYLDFIYDGTVWVVTGTLIGTGTLSTPFVTD